MRRRLHGNQFLGRFDAHVSADEVSDIRQLLVEHLAPQVRHVQVEVILALDPAPFLDLAVHGARDHVTRSKIEQGGSVTLHEPLTGLVAQDAAFAARCLAQQNPQLVNAGGMKLEELHVLERNAAGERHRQAIARERQSV